MKPEITDEIVRKVQTEWVRFFWERVDMVKEKRGIKKDVDLAEVIGIGSSEIGKLRAGTKGIGPKYIARIIIGLETSFDELFESGGKTVVQMRNKEQERITKILLDKIDELEKNQERGKSPFGKTV